MTGRGFLIFFICNISYYFLLSVVVGHCSKSIITAAAEVNKLNAAFI